MTESMKTLLHRQATSVAFKPSDIESIVGTSRRRVRRRRVFATLATVVSVALAGGGVAVLMNRGAEGPPPPPPASPWPRSEVSWATGTTIHVGAAETVDVGHTVNAYVRTVSGFVTLDDTDAVYSVTDAGVTRIGQMLASLPDNTDVQRFVVNSTGTLVAWVDDAGSPDNLAVRVYDTVKGAIRDIPAPRTTPDVHELTGVQLFAIDDRTLYWRTYEGVHEYDLDSDTDRIIVGRGEVSPADAIYSFEVYSAVNGVLAFTPNDDHTMLAGPSVQDATELIDFREYESALQIPAELLARDAEIIVGHTDPARLSPTGAWFSLGIFEAVAVPVGNPADGGAEFGEQRITPMVIETATGELTGLAVPDAMFSMPLVWLDDTTVQVIGFTVDPQQLQTPTSAVFYACRVPEGTCQQEAAMELPIPAFGVFPDGRWYGQR
jgi:hypothetical protein